MLPENYKERITAAIEAFKNWKWVLLLDDATRENECDVIFAAQSITPEQMALLIRECSWIVCLVITQEKAQQLELEMMVKNNESKFTTGFTVSIEAKNGITTWVSAVDRVTTIKTAIAWNAQPSDISKPGHVFPLVAREWWVSDRRWHTEWSYDLVKLAWLTPYAVLCELMNPDGTMASIDDIESFSKKYEMPILTIEDIARYKKENTIF